VFRNYIKVAWRNLTGNKFFSVINIGGLAIGMAVALLIGIWIWDELSYDKQNSNYDHIAQVMRQTTINGETGTGSPSPIPLADELRRNYKEDFKYVVLSWWSREHILSFENKRLTRIGKFMQADAPALLSLKMQRGNWNGLKDPSSILLSASSAKSIFGDEDPIGRLMKIDNEKNVTVTGVYEDIPDNSKFKEVAFIAPWDLLASSDELVKSVSTNWGYDAAEIYVQLYDNADVNKVSAKLKNIELDKIRDDKELLSYKPLVLLQPMSKWHLYAEWKDGTNTGGAIQFVWMFAIIGIFVLLLACINFMNLATARCEKRAKEVGIRKAVGSLKKQLIAQFFCESFLVVVLAFALSLLLIQLALPFFNEVANKKLSIPWLSFLFWSITIGFCFFTSVIAGAYPAFYLSSFKPVKVLKGTFKAGRFAALPRKILVSVQFTVSVTLIICTIIVYQQIQFAKSRPIGYNTDGLIQLQMNTSEFYQHEAALRSELLKTNAVVEMAESSSPTTAVWSGRSGFEWNGMPPGIQTEFGAVAVTPEFGKTVGWQLKQGRDFSSQFLTDSSALVINEAAVRFMHLKHPVGETIKWDGENFTIIGVIKDMVMESPYEHVGQTVYALKKEPLRFITIKISPSISAPDALEKIKKVFEKYVSSSPFDYKFVDENFQKKFALEERIGKLSSLFSALAIFISCLGLFGISAFMAEQRTKEIGVRKVLGASVFNLWKLLSEDFVLLVIISFFIAIPIASSVMHNWLMNYEYHTTISIWVFIITSIGALLITLLTVSIQAIKAAIANPVKSLRSE
jgi:ABC-type antimicrobial peptide transport system permease subunit